MHLFLTVPERFPTLEGTDGSRGISGTASRTLRQEEAAIPSGHIHIDTAAIPVLLSHPLSFPQIWRFLYIPITTKFSNNLMIRLRV